MSYTATTEQKLERVRELFADAPEVGKTALARVLNELESQATQTPPEPIVSVCCGWPDGGRRRNA